ncbi:hypothetical protein RB195_021813 [Necator americanus]|uniref:Uncharacterized protein n=1 Tax=Necator americanus TaxID=51031 RepID=A0ABR1EEW9_NECAM
MEIITERFYSNLFRSSTPVSSSIFFTGEAPPRNLPSETRVAIKSMKPGTISGPDFISTDFLRVGGHPLHVMTLDKAHPQEYGDRPAESSPGYGFKNLVIATYKT